MGTWGPGNFENDNARDYFDTLLNNLVTEIEECFSKTMAPENFLAECGEYKIIPAIDIYVTLSGKFGSFFVDAEMAESWRRNYLLAFDKDDYMYPIDFKPERRQKVVETFDRLDALIASRRKPGKLSLLEDA